MGKMLFAFAAGIVLLMIENTPQGLSGNICSWGLFSECPKIITSEFVTALVIGTLLLTFFIPTTSLGVKAALRAADNAVDKIQVKVGPAPAPASAAKIPTHDTWLQDTVFYVVRGRWLKENEAALNDVSEFNKAAGVIREFRESAERGEITIWGKLGEAELHRKIPKEFWIDHQIDTLHVVGGAPPDRVQTEEVSHGAAKKRYFALKVCKVQIEEIWPGEAA